MVIKLLDQQQTRYQLIIWGGEASFWNMVTGQPTNYDNHDIFNSVQNSNTLDKLTRCVLEHGSWSKMVNKLEDQQQTSYRLVIWGGQAGLWNLDWSTSYLWWRYSPVSPEQPHAVHKLTTVDVFWYGMCFWLIKTVCKLANYWICSKPPTCSS